MTKSIRLNKTIRSEILANIVAAYDKANPCPEDLDDNLLDHQRKAVLAQHREEIAPLEEAVKNNPNLSGYVKWGTSVLFRDTTGTVQTVQLDSDERIIAPSAVVWDLSCPKSIKGKAKLKAIVKKVETQKTKLRAARKARNAWIEERANYTNNIQQILNGVNTSGQLLDAWPEVEKFIPASYVNPSKVNLPAINIADLNSKLS